jgi:hypothetical protein
MKELYGYDENGEQRTITNYKSLDMKKKLNTMKVTSQIPTRDMIDFLKSEGYAVRAVRDVDNSDELYKCDLLVIQKDNRTRFLPFYSG